MSFDPRNILVIDFGQLGDVVLSLPALAAVRERFPDSRITVAAGRPADQVVRLSGYADAVLPINRVALRDESKLLSLRRIWDLVREVRRARFDFVIDLHSLSETNLLGFLSGAPERLYARRPGRSLDFLANFRPRPPVEDYSVTRHTVDRYLDVLTPLAVGGAERTPRLRPRAEDEAAVEQIWRRENIGAGAPLVGLFPGAGHPSKRWPLTRFVEIAERLRRADGAGIVIFAGPEEESLVAEMRSLFPPSVPILNHLTVPQLVSALARLQLFVSNDTGPMHVAAAAGTPVVMLCGNPVPTSFTPVGDCHRVLCCFPIGELPADDVYEAARSLLKERCAPARSGAA